MSKEVAIGKCIAYKCTASKTQKIKERFTILCSTICEIKISFLVLTGFIFTEKESFMLQFITIKINHKQHFYPLK